MISKFYAILSLALIPSAFALDEPRAPYRAYTDCPAHFRHHYLRHVGKGTVDQAFDRLSLANANSIWTYPTEFIRFIGEENLVNSGARPVQLGDRLQLRIHPVGGKLKDKAAIAASFEIVELDRKAQRLIFGYLETNLSQGVQEATFKQLTPDTVEIIHRTCYYSGHGMRDIVLYPPVHARLIHAFYDHLFDADAFVGQASEEARVGVPYPAESVESDVNFPVTESEEFPGVK